MPRVEFSPENMVESPYDYPRISLDKGERARIIVIENEPLMEWVHTLRAPQIVDGDVVMETVKQFDKQVEQPKYDFIGRTLCLGDYSVVDDKGVDPTNCPACKLASEADYVKAPERRFAMHVVKYSLKAGTFDVADPFGVQLVAWTFGNKIFNTITSLIKEWGNLREHDILLGPCENKQYQKFEIKIAGKAEWLASDETKKLVAETYKSQQSPDLAKLIGNAVPIETLKEKLDIVVSRNRIAFGSTPVVEPDFLSGSSSVGGDSSQNIVVPDPETSTEEETPATPVVETGGSVNFDDLLSELEST